MTLEDNKDLYEFSPSLEDEYQGSLTILLDLIQKKKKDIRDIDIKELTDQFLAYVMLMETKVPLEVFSDYANMSAYLIELKTRSLLPDYANNLTKYNRTLEEEKEAFIKRLLEHQMYKNAIPLLNELKTQRQLHYDKDPEEFEEYLSAEIPMGKLPKRINVEKLKEIFESILDRQSIKEQLEKPIDLHIQNHEYSVSEVIHDLITYLIVNKDGVLLSQYFDEINFTKRNIDYYCMLFFVILSLIHQANIVMEERNQDLFLKVSDHILYNKGISDEFIRNIKNDLIGE
ncbi:segregation and condensation protein A [Ureaplasma ceti]|uniref:Segregation and condensation protein A n=1 Tax=Ureaplasma ceti TaxID=3119530 RepID=A0ABP9U972_9BACT